jgi:phage baseplate assembly protein W
MANGKTYGINFPFRDSFDGKYLDLSDTVNEEIRTDLIHLLLTRKGARYFLPDFGTRLYEYIFEPLDGPTFTEIEAEIRDSIEKYIPNLTVNNITIIDASSELSPTESTRIYSVPNRNELEHTAKVRIDYTLTSSVFNSKDFIIINI